MFTESQLLTALSCGDQSAFTQLYDTRWDKLYRYALSIVEANDEAEDVCADVFAAVWEKRTTVEKIQEIDNYLIALVRNKCFDIIRASKRKKLKMRELNDPSAIDGHDKRFEVLSLYTGVVLNKIDLLPFGCQRIIRLYYMEGWSHDEIAEILNLSKNTVRNHRYNGLRHLKEMSSLRPGAGFSSAVLLLAAPFCSFFQNF